jgi:N-acetyl-gamma-glutamyl-phosphate reductase
MLSSCDVVFLAKPHGQHGNVAADFLARDIKVIDLSADFRLKDLNVFAEWYKPQGDHATYYYGGEFIGLLGKAVYGLPEIHSGKIAKANLVANPGCYPTSVILGSAPLFKEKLLLDNFIIADSYSGVSGAGRSRKDETQFIDINENIRPYKIGTHNHTPEMEQELSQLGGEGCKVLFAPHIMPIDVGIISTIYIKYAKKLNGKELTDLYNAFYANKQFIRIYENGALPQVKDVANTNFCDIGITIDDRTACYVITSVIDNTMKGAASQAIQNMNLMFGLDEGIGLPFSRPLQKKKDSLKCSSHK